MGLRDAARPGRRAPWGGRGVFRVLALAMVGLGLAVGVVFPPFVVILGVPGREAYRPAFVAACLVAGAVAGLLNHAVARLVIGRRLRLLSERLHDVAQRVRKATVAGDGPGQPVGTMRIAVDSDDELGDTAGSFNELLDALARQERFRALVRHSSDVITVADADGTIRHQTPSVEAVLGYASGELAGTAVTALVHPEDLRESAAHLAHLASRPGSQLRMVARVRHRDGAWRDVETVAVNLLDDPVVGGLVLTSRDVTERTELERQLSHQAFHDALTGLANRALLAERLRHALARCQRSGGFVAVLVLDLDGFKAVNDGLGHAVGDELLVAVAERLVAGLRPGDTAARLGGDEFVVLVEDLNALAEAGRVAERVLESLLVPFEAGGRRLDVQASIGVATNATAQDPDDLVRNADVAMYRAKARGKACYEVFAPHMHLAAVARLELEAGLRLAVERDELVLHFQPIVDLRTGEVRSAEALVRWQHPERGLVPPVAFVPAAEETGLVLPIGRWALERACLQARRWQDRFGERAPSVSVNFSARQLHHPDVVCDVSRALRRAGLEPGRLVLEMTESVLIDDVDDGLAKLGSLKELGVLLAIDDFGTGYSSLAYLQRFPVDVLKIDRSFVDGIEGDGKRSALVRAVIDLAETFGLKTVAEGVETTAQWRRLRAMGCELGQGYRFARPLAAEDLEHLLVGGRAPRGEGDPLLA